MRKTKNESRPLSTAAADMSSSRRAPPFKRRFEAAIATARAAGATRVKVNPDGSCEVDFRPDAETVEINDFDRPPNPPRTKRGKAST